MTTKNNDNFLSLFPGHTYRYIDQTGEARPPISSAEMREDLNLNKYESYFTVNGFKGAINAKKENCSSLNAFFVDIDGRKDMKELVQIRKKLDPTYIIETMNGFHIYWVLKEPIFKGKLIPAGWDESIAQWERTEQAIVLALKSDPVVKDLTRILRVPGTTYWKKTDGKFKIKIIHSKPENTYTMDQVEKIFPSALVAPVLPLSPADNKTTRMKEAQRNIFFENVNIEFPIEERDSFKALISAAPDSLPAPNMRNNVLLITATLAKQAGWSKQKFLDHIGTVGWHGMENEAGGLQEIANTVNSAFARNYTYSYKNEAISYNMSALEAQRMNVAYTKVLKTRKEQDKVRFSTYEREILSEHPYLKKNEIGIVFDYKDGVYRMMSDQEVSDMILNGLEEDMLWNFRTKKNVADKLACLISKIPLLSISNDGGYVVNVKNGLLNIYTRELRPHTPEYVSLVQFPVVYDPRAKAPVWEECVKSWMEGPEQEGKTALLKQFCGYCLSSSMLYDRALFLVGDGGNGKSTFVDSIAMVFGPDSTAHIDLESLYGAFGLQGLIGKRLNIIEEVHGNYYQSNKLKKLISGEKVTIDVKYKPQFTFRPQAKFIFSVNSFPRVDDTSTATERRICAITFLNNYRKNPNFQLRSAFGLLAQELSGILNWMIDGAADLVEKGNFTVTKEQTRMLEEYRQENSSVEGFLVQCIVLEREATVTTSDLYFAYKRWSMSEGGRKIKSNITFTKEVKAFGAKDNRFTFSERESSRTESFFTGIKLNPRWIQESNLHVDNKFSRYDALL